MPVARISRWVSTQGLVLPLLPDLAQQRVAERLATEPEGPQLDRPSNFLRCAQTRRRDLGAV